MAGLRRERWFSDALKFIFTFTGILLLGRVGLLFATVNQNASPIWPPTGFSLFCLVAFGARFWPAVFLAAFTVNWLAPSPWPVAMGIACGNVVEGLLGRAIFFAVLSNRNRFSYQSKSLALITACFIPPVLNASIGVSTLLIADVVGWEKGFAAWTTWYGGDLIGGLLLAPLLLEVRSKIQSQLEIRWRAVGSLVVAFGAFILVLNESTFTALLGVAFPLCLWVLLSHGALSALTLLNLIGCSCAVGAWLGLGPFVRGPMNVNLLYHILFLCSLSVTVLTLIAFKKARALQENLKLLFFFWCATCVLVFGLEMFSKGKDEARFDALVAEAKVRVKGRMNAYERALQGGVAFIQASNIVSRSEWRHFAAEFNLNTVLPGVFGFGFIQRVEKRELNEVLKRIRADGAPGYTVRPVPDSDLDTRHFNDYFLVKYIEPEEKNRVAVGLDVGTGLSRRLAAERARDTGRPVMTGQLTLIQDARKRPGFLLLAPVYTGAVPPATLEDRRRFHVGWTYAPFVMEDFLTAALGNLLDEVSIEIHESEPAGSDQVVYATPDDEVPRLFTDETERRDEIELAQHRFTLLFGHGKSFVYSRDQTTAWAGASGMLFGLVIVSSLVNLQISNRRIREQVEAKTSELVRAQEIAESHRMKSIEAARLASLGEMAGGIAHEINNPLTIIMTRTDQFRSKIQTSGELNRDEIQTYLQKIDQTTLRIAKIVRGMRKLASDGSRPDYQEIFLSELIEDALDVCREKFRSRGIHLSVDIEEDVRIECQPVQISQVLVNLLNNSEHAIEDMEAPWIRIRAFLKDEIVHVEVVDSGKRIPTHVAARMMEPFFTTKEVGKGTGLGLSIARRIMEENHGSLTYDASRPHTTFTLVFPKRVPSSSSDIEFDKSEPAT